jgi:hypothetical protein
MRSASSLATRVAFGATLAAALSKAVQGSRHRCLGALSGSEILEECCGSERSTTPSAASERRPAWNWSCCTLQISLQGYVLDEPSKALIHVHPTDKALTASVV